MRRFGRWPQGVALAAACLLSGCIATQRDVLELEQQSDEIKFQVSELKKSVASLQANQADLAIKIDQVHSDLSVFTETLKDSQNSMGQLSSKIDDLQAVLERKMSGLGETIGKRQSQLEERIQETEAKAIQAQKEAERLATARLTPSQLFRSAQTHLNKKQHALAVQGFETYLKKYPKAEAADQALYFLGEAHSAQKAWEKAARQYALVLDKHPKSKLTPAARLKYATCLIHMNTELGEAKRYLQSISEDFPKSPESAAAVKLLQKIPPAKSRQE
ncbi:MAG: tetratricopeptide repeat protein [Elusimicrobia bacterium]|nr:tetratricopeptide repeat protein [Elusimicrobiota bacterium]